MAEKIRGASFSASGGPDIMKGHEKLVCHFNRMVTIRLGFGYGASVCFAGMATFLLIFPPLNQGQLAFLAAAGLLVLATCLAAFTSLTMFFPSFRPIASFREETK